MPFGVSASPLIFQRYMDELLQGIDCTGTLLDDIIITGPTRQEHLQNLREVLKRLKQAGLRLKCRFMQKSQGIHLTEEKVEAIKKTPTPRNVKDLRAFLGSINFHERFISQLHACCANLHHITSKRRNQATVVPYDETRPLVLACDASEREVGAVLFQTMVVGQDRPIAFASRTLKVERHYAPIDREALALSDISITICGDDHLSSKRTISHWNEFLEKSGICQRLPTIDCNVEYQPGKENQSADALSRLPMPTTIKSSRERKFVNLVMQGKVEDLALSTKILHQATAKDPVLSKIKRFVDLGWPMQNDKVELKPYFERRE
ncbi:hypothetical protein J437_LFUL008902 [Ladona fulva]|uniref:Reverse transcriptase domain-containing protein n=1 Tax=Ladona fulva TaxID=123851 RepID=A0A8K0NY19_LADFU|nr:hypothetical protein J437_LFUL008902 [Ladona fulva]